MYDDEKIPIRGGKRDLGNGTDFIFVKNISNEPRTRIQKRVLADDTGGTLSTGRVKRVLFEDDPELVRGFQNFGISSSGEIDTCINLSDAPLTDQYHMDVVNCGGNQISDNNWNQEQEYVSPTKRPRTHSPPLSPVHIDVGGFQPVIDSTICPQRIRNKKIMGVKTFTNEQLKVHISKCGSNITIVKIESDAEMSPNDLVGPRFYKNSGKLLVHYSFTDRVELGIKWYFSQDSNSARFSKI